MAVEACRKNQEPQAHCDEVVAAFQELWRQLDISYDSFIRTTDPKHELVVADILDRVWQKGDIYKANYNGIITPPFRLMEPSKALFSEDGSEGK